MVDALLHRRYFPTILIVIMAVFNDGAMIALAKDKVEPSRKPNSWNLNNIFIMGIVYGLYLTLSSWALYQTAVKTSFFEDHLPIVSLDDRHVSLESWCLKYIAERRPDLVSLRGWPGRWAARTATVMTVDARNSECGLHGKPIAKWFVHTVSQSCERLVSTLNPLS